MKFNCDSSKKFFLIHVKSKAARRFQIFGILILVLALVVCSSGGSESLLLVAPVIVCILLILLYRKTIRSINDHAFNQTVEIHDGTLVERHSFRIGLKVIHVTQTVTDISAIHFYEKTEEIEIIGYNRLVSSDNDQSSIMPSCYLLNCYGPDFLKSLEENTVSITVKKYGGKF